MDDETVQKQMLSDLTPQEVVACVYMIQAMPDGAMVVVDGKLTLLEDAPGMQSFARKLNEAGNRDDVKEYVKRISGDGSN